MRWLLCLLVGLLIAAELRAESADVRAVAALRERGQYQQAADYAAERWQRDDLADCARAELAIQLALVYTEHAMAAPPGSRDALWAKADDACAALIDGWPDNPRRALVEVQRALVSLARGQQAREAVAGTAAAPGQIAHALEHLRTATRRLADVADDVGRALIELRLRPAASRSPDALSVQELESLEANLSFHLARAQRQLGLCYPPRSADRDDALLQAVRRLTPLAQQAPPDELAWNAREELAVCQRDLGRLKSAQALIAGWLRDDPPPEVAARLSAEPGSQTTVRSSDDASAHILAAEHLHLAGQIDEAIVRYGRAAERFQQRGQPDEVFAAVLAAAAIERAADRHAAAAERYRQLALRQPSHARAAEAHRLAILSTADALRQGGPAPDEAAAAYEALLEEHLGRWPAHSTADEVRLWLGRLLAGRRQWPEAIALLQQVSRTAGPLAESVTLIIDCYENQLRQLDGREAIVEQQRDHLIAAATQHLQPVVTGPDNRWPDAWSDLQRKTAVSVSRLHLRYSTGPSPYAERLLTAALHGEPAAETDKDEAFETTARTLLVEALARNGKATEALAMLEVLDVQRDKLDAEALAQLAEFRTMALAAAGDRAAALAEYAELAAQSSDDGDIQERYAALLAASDSSAELHQALSQWQEVEARSRRGGPRWHRARQARIELLTRLGDQEEAEKLVRLTRLLYPDWDNAVESSK